MKYYNTPLRFNRKEEEFLRNKIALFKDDTGTRKNILLTMVTAEGVINNEFSTGLIDGEIQLKDLFD